MNVNSGSEFNTALSDIPVFLCGLALLAVSYRKRNRGRCGRNWFWIAAGMAVASAGGMILHGFRLSESVLRVAWPVEFFIITMLAAAAWIHLVSLLRPDWMGDRMRKAVAVYSASVGIVNGIIRFLKVTDMAVLFCLVGVPAVLHTAAAALMSGTEEKRDIRRRLASAAVLLVLSVAAEGAFRSPMTIMGLEVGGAFISHLLLCAAMIGIIGIAAGSVSYED